MAAKLITSDISYYVTVDDEKIIKRQRLFQSDHYNKKSTSSNSDQLLLQQPSNKIPTRVPSLKTVARSWLNHYNDDNIESSSILSDMILLKRSLLFSIDQFIHHLNLSAIPCKDILPLLIAYHNWSKLTKGTLMPLMALLLPLIKMDLTNNNKNKVLLDCFQQFQNDFILQDYLEAIIHYLHTNTLNSKNNSNNNSNNSNTVGEKQKENVILVQNWIDHLLKQDRNNIAFYSICCNNLTTCSKIYLAYYDVFLDKNRLKYLSWSDKKRWIMKEWDIWIQLLMENKNDHENHNQSWMQEKSDIIQYKVKMDKGYKTFIEKNILWFNEFNPAISSSLVNFIIDQVLAEKIIPITIVWGIYHFGCEKIKKSNQDQDSVYIVKVLDDIKNLILQHLNDHSIIISILLSVIQISLYYFDYIIPYQQWFEATFVNASTSLKSKRENQMWIIHMENMISYEIPTILQIHAKVYNDIKGSSAINYVTLVKKRLLALGVECTLRNYPTTVFILDQHSKQLKDNVNINNISNSNNNNSNNNNNKAGNSNVGIHLSDLEELLKIYDDTKTVPKGLWEDSIFRPKWFKLTFLPALIHWKITDEKMNDNRSQLIEALNAKRKIPTSLYQQFINK
ncbi:unnamed protein product [Cunninghamella blakesleeana]